MCFGKKDKPQPGAGQVRVEKGGPVDGPRPASSQRPASASRRRSVHNPTHQNIGKLPALPGDGPQTSREPRVRRARSTSQLNPRESRQPTGSGPQRTSKRQSHYQSDRVIIAVMGVTGKIQTLFKTCIAWLREVIGAGKSYFIREVTGNPEVKVSGGLYSRKIAPPL